MIRAFIFAAAVLLLAPFVEHALDRLAPDTRSLPMTCIGPADARVKVVYLHGLDSYGPSWVEIENREKLRALSRRIGARFALPRAATRWAGVRRSDESAQIVRDAARQCFGGAATAVLGFSDGANLTNELFLACRADVATQFLSVGSSTGAVSRSRTQCGQMTLFAGRHEPNFSTTRQFAQ